MDFISEIRNTNELFDEESKTGSQRDDLHLMLQDWINMIFSFLKSQKLEEAIEKA